MSKKAWRALGTSLFWLLWPALVIYLNRSERARILVVQGDEVLLVKSWLGAGKWGLPGGGLHKGEPVLDGCLRELHEETGIAISKEHAQPLFSGTYSHRGFTYLCHYFVAVLGTKPTVTTQKIEISDFVWMNRKNLVAKNVQPDALTTVTAWFES